MAELVDALDSKSCDSNIVRVRFPLWAHKKASRRRCFFGAPSGESAFLQRSHFLKRQACELGNPRYFLASGKHLYGHLPHSISLASRKADVDAWFQAGNSMPRTVEKTLEMLSQWAE